MVPTPPSADAAASRPSSLWPHTASAGPAAAASSQFSHFDPLAEQREAARARAAALATAAFDVCHPALALRAVLLVQLALAVVALAGAADAAGWMARQAVLAFGGTAATLLWLVTVCALRRPLAALPAGPRAGAVMLLGALVALAPWWPLAAIGLVMGSAWQGAAAAAGGALAASLLWAWLALRARAWQPEDSRARLAELQSRIRPHFLFNTLNTAVALVRADPERAERVLEDLAELFRTALAEVGSSVTLAEELELVRRYLDIESVRFGRRLVVHWDIDERAGAARVPPLLLQPLAENAVRHGVEPVPAGGEVWLRTRRRRGEVEVSLVNTVGSAAGQPGQGIALANVRERLRLLHDVAAHFEAGPAAPGDDGRARFEVRLVLPAP
jgi:two-component system sensor histidine kinase AlgZ